MPSEPYYQDDWCTIYHGDCRDVLPTLTADVVVTDPPYGMSLDTGRSVALANAQRFTRQGKLRTGRTYAPVVGDDHPFDPAPFLAVAPCLFFGANYFAQTLPSGRWHVWDKTDGGAGSVGLGNEFELIWTSYPSGRSRVLRYNWSGLHRVNTQPDSFQHPTQKPVGLMRLLLDESPPGTVLDPFMGSGTTLRAAKDLGRYSVGVEIEERYCEIAAKRLAQEVLDFGGAA